MKYCICSTLSILWNPLSSKLPLLVVSCCYSILKLFLFNILLCFFSISLFMSYTFIFGLDPGPNFARKQALPLKIKRDIPQNKLYFKNYMYFLMFKSVQTIGLSILFLTKGLCVQEGDSTVHYRRTQYKRQMSLHPRVLLGKRAHHGHCSVRRSQKINGCPLTKWPQCLRLPPHLKLICCKP